MVAATLWIAESERLRVPLEYCHLFGEMVHSQTALKYAYLKAMSSVFLYGSSTLRRDESSVARQAMQWHPLDGYW